MAESTTMKSLYELSVRAVAEHFISHKKQLGYLPTNVLFDLYYQVILIFLFTHF